MFIKNYQKIDRNKGIWNRGGRGAPPTQILADQIILSEPEGGGADNAPRIFSFSTIPET